MSDDTPIEQLMNFGPKTKQWLADLGIQTAGDVKQWSYPELYDALKSEGRPVNRVFFYALWGALNNCHWREVPEDVKQAISRELGYTNR